jgi:hypothetical protein
MATEVPASSQRRPGRHAPARWLRLLAVAAVLLAASEALWLWQTWPVRELLHFMVPAAQAGSGR